jgi:hypothetical protein
VTTKKPKTGGECDAYCTKCKLDLGHRIIAMVGESIKKVECRTCHSHHLYRRPKAEKDAQHARAAERRLDRAGGATSEKPGGPRMTAAQRLERDQTVQWEHAIAGKPATAFKPYRITTNFDAGELVRHPKFGDGVVARVIDRGKVEVLFKDGPKTMAQGQQ